MSVSVLWYFVIKLSHFIKTFVILCNKKKLSPFMRGSQLG